MMTAVLNVLRFSRCGWAVIALLLSIAADGNAQSHEWLVGLWSGTYTQLLRPVSCTLAVRDEGGKLQWTFTANRREGPFEAEGIVTKFDASSAELEGKFISHFTQDYVGTGFKMTLTGSPNTLSGSWITERGSIPATLKLIKGK